MALLRQMGVLLLRMGPRGALNVTVAGGPVIGEKVPDAALVTLDGRIVPLILEEELPSGIYGTTLVFTSPTCGSCSMIPAAVSSLASSYRDVRFCVLARGAAEGLSGYSRLFPTGVCIIPDDGTLITEYSITDLPYAVFVDSQGVVRHKGIVNNREHLEDLIIKGLAVCRHRRDRQAAEAQAVGTAEGA